MEGGFRAWGVRASRGASMSAVSASEASELVNLLLMVLLVPMTVIMTRRLVLPGQRWFLTGFLIVVAVRVYSVIERYLLGNPVVPVKQFAVAAAGIAFAIAAWQLALALRRREVL